MAETLKFGAGEWATKKGSTLAYNSENGNFKPLPFTFDRSTSATRVNKEGLIEVVSNNEPRIDFLNDSKGALKLEPSRSNLITYSEDLTQWNVILGGVFSVTSNTTDFISPSGKFDASKVEFTNSNQAIGQSPTLSGNYSGYVYIKGTKGETIRFNFGGSEQNFTLTGEWDKLERTNVTSTAGAFNLNTFGGVTSRTIYVWGAQLEQGSYATSYIPTQGSIGTRVAESSSQTPPDGIIGQTEGTMFYDGYYGDEPAEVYLFLQENLGNGVSDSIYIQKFGSNSIAMQVYDGNNFQTQLSGGSYVSGQRIKIAVAYKQNDFALYINNVQIGVSSGGLVPNLNGIQIGTYPALSDTHNYIASKGVNNVQLYNTRLSNSELAALTKI